MKIIRFILFVFMLPLSLFASEVGIELNGHLSEETLERAQKQLEDLQTGDQLALIVNSSSGDLQKTLRFAKEIYGKKSRLGTSVVVYIDDLAIGPAAILPFLADDLFTSLLVSWGDIPLEGDSVPTQLLRSNVLSLIPDQSPHAQELQIMAEAMVDPSYVTTNRELMIKKDETLVVNHKQLQKLNLVQETMSKKAFRDRFFPEESVNAETTEMDSSLESRLRDSISYSEMGTNLVGRIVIDDRTSGINQATWLYVKSALDYYKEKKPIFIILELNTPGGEVFAAQKISDALKDIDIQNGIPVVTFINNWAISAGAMLAYSTRFISVVKDASMGAAEPVLQTGEGMESASEKVNSAIRVDFANRASFFDRNPLIAEAMVDKDLILVKRFGKIVKLANEDQIRSSGPNPDELITAEGKLLTLNAKELMNLGVADLLLPPKTLDPVTTEEKRSGKWPATKSLLFQAPFFNNIPGATIDEYQMDWKTEFFSYLAHPAVASLLFMGVLIGFYMEMSTPGFGLAGSVGIICLFLVILSSFALDAVNWLELIFLFGGIVLIALDLFLIPTFGILGLAGVVAVIAGLLGLLIPGIESSSYDFDTQSFNAAGDFALERLVWLCGAFVLSLVIMAVIGKYLLPRFAPLSHLVLIGGEQDKADGYIAGEKMDELPPIGTEGIVVGMLRPTGKVEVNGQLYHAVTHGEYLEDGHQVVVEDVDGSVLVVNPKEMN